jgi:hypothetical protein
MELGFLLVVAVSAGAGLLLRTRVNASAGRALLMCGVGALVLALAVLGFTVAGVSLLGVWTAGLIAALLFGVAGFVLPFALAVSLGRTATGSGGGRAAGSV